MKTTQTDNANWCGLCAGYLAGDGHCPRCGAITRLEMTPEAEAWQAERIARQDAFEHEWRAMTPEEREAARRMAEKRGGNG